MEIVLADLWFVIDVPYHSSSFPETAYYGETAQADAAADAALKNADPALALSSFRLTYKAADYHEVYDMVTDNVREDI